MGGKKSDSQDAPVKEQKTIEKKVKKSSDLPPEPPRPNREDFEAKKKLIDAKIEQFREELKELANKISSCTTGKSDFDAQKEECFQRLNETREKIDNLKGKKDELQAKIRERSTLKREAVQAMRQLDRDMKELNSEALEDRILQLEHRMQVDTMPLNEEKKLMVEIKTLKSKRPEVAKKAKKLDELRAAGDASATGDGNNKSGDGAGDELTEVRKQLEELMKKRDEQKQDIQALKDEREVQTGPIKDFINERNKQKDNLTQQQNEMKTLWDDYKGAQRIHNEWDKKRRETQKHKLEEERARSDELWQAQKSKEELEKTMEKPYFEELTNLEQTIAFCQSFIKTDDDGEKVDDEDAKCAHKEKIEGFVQGATVTGSKFSSVEDRGPKGKKGKKKNQGAAKNAKKGLTHTAATFQMFAQLKVSAPMTVEEVPAVIVKLNVSLDDYKKKVDAWETEAANRREQLKVADEKIARLEAEEAAVKEARRQENKKAEDAEKAAEE